MSNIQILNFHNLNVRTDIDENNNIWFCAKDVCDALGHNNHRKALTDHVHEEDVTKRYSPTKGG